MRISLSKIDGVIVVLAQHELTLLLEHYPQEVALEKGRLEKLRDILNDLSSEPQDEHVSVILNRVVSQFFDVPLYEKWGNITMAIERITEMLDGVSRGEIHPHKLVRLIDFCNIFYKKLDQELHGSRNFNSELIPA